MFDSMSFWMTRSGRSLWSLFPKPLQGKATKYTKKCYKQLHSITSATSFIH